MKANKITTPCELRNVLLGSIEALIEGKITTLQANSIVGLSQEIHKSVKQEFEMRCYAAENMAIENGKITKHLLD